VKLDLFCDLETFSTVPITHGSHAYAEGAEVMLWPYAFGDGPTLVWDVTTGEPMPDDLRAGLDDGGQLTVWHNGGMFDTVVLPHALNIDLPIERVHDTMVQAYAHSLPGSLGQLCEVLKVPSDAAKSKEGKRLIRLFCMPQKFTHRLTRAEGESVADLKVRIQTARDEWVGRATRLTHPVEWAEFIEYAKADITAMRECKKRMPNWNYKGFELALWHLDQKINRRGMFMDLALARGALAAVAQAQVELAEQASTMTEGQVPSTTQRNLMLDHIAEQYGVILSDLQMATVERMHEDPDTHPGLRALLGIRLQASTTSTSKYKTVVNAVSRDGRLRGTMQFDGASRTGRIGHRLMQPGNMPRPTIKQWEIDSGIAALKAGCADLVTDNVMRLTSSAIRSCIIAPPNKKLTVADLSNIEGRVLAWLAGEAWKLDAFRAFDNGTGHDLYAIAYAKSFGVTAESVMEDKKRGGNQRQIGKVQELALGFASGVNGIATFAAAYNIDLDALAALVLPVAPGWAVDEAETFRGWMLKQKKIDESMARDAFIACDAIKRVWRQAHPMTASLWAELEAAVKEAISNPSITITCRKLKVRRDGAWLRIGLPSGRAVCYPSPQVDDKGVISYMGIHQFSRKWVRIGTYGGKLVENCTQAVARDILFCNMPAIEAEGYAAVLSIHDELLTETPDTEAYTHTRLAELMSTQPAWALDMPLAAAGFETYAYRKD
jgi:DNA polymerase